MNALSIMGFFCEDIREEAGGTVTLIGLMPDNVNVEELKKQDEVSLSSRVITKVCVFVRANFDPDDPTQEISLHLTLPNDQKFSLGKADAAVMQQAKQQAREKGSPLAGITLRAVLGGFSLPKLGVMKLDATIGSERRLLAALNFAPSEKASSSSGSELPSPQ
jgi:hypothetical protein